MNADQEIQQFEITPPRPEVIAIWDALIFDVIRHHFNPAPASLVYPQESQLLGADLTKPVGLTVIVSD